MLKVVYLKGFEDELKPENKEVTISSSSQEDYILYDKAWIDQEDTNICPIQEMTNDQQEDIENEIDKMLLKRGKICSSLRKKSFKQILKTRDLMIKGRWTLWVILSWETLSSKKTLSEAHKATVRIFLWHSCFSRMLLKMRRFLIRW